MSTAPLPLDSVASLFENFRADDSSALPAAVLRLIGPVLPADHCAIFSFRPDQPPRLECEASLSPRAPFPADVGLAYERGHYRFDSLGMFITRLRTQQDDLTLFEQGRDDIGNPTYLRNCYDRCNVIDRLSILVPTAEAAPGRAHWLAVNLYRVDGAAPFVQEELRDAFGVLTVLGAAVKARYRGASHPCTRADECGIRALSAREAQVTELVAAGLSSKAIATRLGIGLSTVVTLRKRACEKLDAANGHALSARWAALTSPALSAVCPKNWGQTRARRSN